MSTELSRDENATTDKKGKKIASVVVKVVVCLIILAVISLILLYLWQKDNIDAVVNAGKYSTEELQSQIESSQENVQAVLNEYNVTQIRDLTPEEELELCKGNLSPEEAVALIMGESGEAQSDDESQSGDKSQSGAVSESTGQVEDKNNSVSTDEKTAIVKKYVSQMYTLKAKYMGELGSLAKSAKAKYDADKQSVGKAKAVENAVSANLSKAASLESQCDKEVESLLSAMESELNAIGADTSVVNTIRTEYQNEKSLKKSYYLSLKNQ